MSGAGVVDWLDRHLERSVASIFLVVMTTAIFIQIITRYLGVSLSWTEELARYCFIWMIYIGVSYAAAKKSHLRIDSFLSLLNEKERAYMNLISDICFFCFSCVVIFYSTRMVINLYALEQISPALGMPMWIVYLAGPVGFSLTAFRLLQHIADRVSILVESS